MPRKNPQAEFNKKLHELSLNQLGTLTNDLTWGQEVSRDTAVGAANDLIRAANTVEKQCLLAEAAKNYFSDAGKRVADAFIRFLCLQTPAADPDRLFLGRQADEATVVELCRKNPFQLIVGPSGVGKSTLCIEALTPDKLSTENIRWTPIFIDGRLSEATISTPIQRALKQFSAFDNTDVSAFDLFDRVEAESADRMLIVIDQVDDYFERHHGEFMHDNQPVVLQRFLDSASSTDQYKTPARSDWVRLAQFAEAEKIHVALIIRDDSLAQRVFAFDVGGNPNEIIDDRRWALAGISAESVREYFHDEKTRQSLTEASKNPDVYVELANDFVNGLILPIRLSLALDALNTTPIATPSEYRKLGRLDGIIRRHIQREVANAANASHLPIVRLFAALSKMDNQHGKTCPIGLRTFAAVAMGQPLNESRRPTNENGVDSITSEVKTAIAQFSHIQADSRTNHRIRRQRTRATARPTCRTDHSGLLTNQLRAVLTRRICSTTQSKHPSISPSPDNNRAISNCLGLASRPSPIRKEPHLRVEESRL